MIYKDLVYCSSPARLGDKKKEILDFVASKNKGPLHPFNALPYEYFEGGRLGRNKTMEVCCRLVDFCDEFWIFGISEGTLIELEYFFDKGYEKDKPLKIFIKEFDPEWEKFTVKFESRFAPALKKLSL